MDSIQSLHWFGRVVQKASTDIASEIGSSQLRTNPLRELISKEDVFAGILAWKRLGDQLCYIELCSEHGPAVMTRSRIEALDRFWFCDHTFIGGH
jgi:hypothetical protein